tara:strand:+ start:26155 stop:26694 length:540 start_codon:yes stop_codon:yes gene_type:complete
MCDPVSATLLIAGAAASAYSASQQVKAQNKANEQNAQSLERNAIQADKDAAFADTQGKKEELRNRNANRRLMGQQRASMGASGATADVGSFNDVLSDTNMIGDIDSLSIQSNTKRESDRFRFDAGNLRTDASNLRSRKQSASAAAGLSLLGSASSFAPYGGKTKKTRKSSPSNFSRSLA